MRTVPFLPAPLMDDTATVTRTTFARDQTGTAVDGPSTTFPIDCATAPGTLIDDRLARQLEESGVRISGARQFWTDTELRMPTPTTHADLISYADQTWRVEYAQPWGPFWEVVAVRQEPQ